MLVFAFGLMLVAFRSLVIAVKAIVLNLLSVAAAYGVLVLVFQHGVGKGLLGFSSTAGIDPVVPLLLFVILFGLSMDYHVFILSRIRETFDRGASMDDAVAHGIKSTAGVVTSAAVVMVAVFSIFATLSMLFFKQFGVGLAAAILIDATIVRAVLLPATMKLLGDWNWYLPALARVAAPARAAHVRARPQRSRRPSRIDRVRPGPAGPGSPLTVGASRGRARCLRDMTRFRASRHDSPRRTPRSPRRRRSSRRPASSPSRSSRSRWPGSRTSASRPTPARSPCPRARTPAS